MPIDIEHIQYYHDKDGEKPEDIWEEWQEDINSIGNLMILEQEINRSISNNTYDKKYNFILKVYSR
ncbi:MAG: HNH endonuclease [Bacteroidales bacterium]|nr:HNH endonuclease [Bacteroidales bacterium]